MKTGAERESFLHTSWRKLMKRDVPLSIPVGLGRSPNRPYLLISVSKNLKVYPGNSQWCETTLRFSTRRNGESLSVTSTVRTNLEKSRAWA